MIEQIRRFFDTANFNYVPGEKDDFWSAPLTDDVVLCATLTSTRIDDDEHALNFYLFNPKTGEITDPIEMCSFCEKI